LKFKKYFTQYTDYIDSPVENKVINQYKHSKKRKNKERKKKQSKKIYGSAIFADHMKCCSCMMCRNPRHGYKSKKTLQERKFDIETKLDYKDV